MVGRVVGVSHSTCGAGGVMPLPGVLVQQGIILTLPNADQFVGQIEGVMNAAVHAESPGWTIQVGGVTRQ